MLRVVRLELLGGGFKDNTGFIGILPQERRIKWNKLKIYRGYVRSYRLNIRYS